LAPFCGWKTIVMDARKISTLTLKQANISITMFKRDSVINLLLKENGGAILAQKTFLFLHDILIFSAASEFNLVILKECKFLFSLLLLIQF
jgi:hypothetical protein